MDSTDLAAARKRASQKLPGQEDKRDSLVNQLVLRRRGASVSWLYKTRNISTKIDDAKTVGLNEARAEARRIAGDEQAFIAGRNAKRDRDASMTFGELLKAYYSYAAQPHYTASGLREKSPDTLRDMRLSYSRAAVKDAAEMPVANMNANDLRQIRDSIKMAHSVKQSSKAMSYINSAFKYGLENLPGETQLSERFWKLVGPSEVSGVEAIILDENRKTLGNPEFGPEEAAEFLRRHRKFCDENKVTSAVRYGTEFIICTGMRSGAAAKLRVEAVESWDYALEPDWLLATWSKKEMKGKCEFSLPLSPYVANLVRESIAAHKNFRSEKWGPVSLRNPKKYVFENATHQPLGESAIRQHLRRMRGWQSVGNEKLKTGPDLLHDLPNFSLHSIRTSIATLLDDEVNIQMGASSAMIAHTTAAQGKAIAATPKVTKSHYSRAQRLKLKAQAVKAWMEALGLEKFDRT